MHKSIVYPLFTVLTICLVLPASAQLTDRDVPPGGLARNDAECHAQFNRADTNGDGVLTPREVSSRRSLVPPRLTAAEASDSLISRQDFLSACAEGARSPDSGT
jgi:hypothetical protein